MHKNKIFVKTAKAEKKGAKLDTNLKRLLSFLDGKTSSGDLSRRAPPSLRKIWDDLIAELLKGEYIVAISAEASQERKVKPGELNPIWKGQVEARVGAERMPPAAPTPAKALKSPDVASLPAAFAPGNTQLPPAIVNKTASVVVDAEESSAARQKAEKAARAAELKAYFATAKEKAKVEAKQAALEAERARAEVDAAAAAAKLSAEAENKAKMEAQKRVEEAERARAELEAAVAAAKARSDALAKAKAKAEAVQRDVEAERARAELEAAIAASKSKSDAKTRLKVEVEQETAAVAPPAKSEQVSKRHRFYKLRGKFCVMDAAELARLRNLQAENEALKNLLTEAYMEITSLKSSMQNKT